MNADQDLSLLTDEEREWRARGKAIMDALTAEHKGTGLSRFVVNLTDALMSARAENKRKDEVIAGLRAVVQEVAERPTVSETPGVHADEFTDLEDALTLQARALLQSEKGGAE